MMASARVAADELLSMIVALSAVFVVSAINVVVALLN
jgi:hypothetical protein